MADSIGNIASHSTGYRPGASALNANWGSTHWQVLQTEASLNVCARTSPSSLHLAFAIIVTVACCALGIWATSISKNGPLAWVAILIGLAAIWGQMWSSSWAHRDRGPAIEIDLRAGTLRAGRQTVNIRDVVAIEQVTLTRYKAGPQGSTHESHFVLHVREGTEDRWIALLTNSNDIGRREAMQRCADAMGVELRETSVQYAA
ncbi:MAG TPA: hypothetical protein VK157_04260 [Phycisphaerales bacterium]|nr:hypothetical protein [Phycisphaerales bacterium]